MKICRVCLKEKLEDEFSAHRLACRDCELARNRDAYYAHKAARSAKAKEWRDANKPHIRAWYSKYYQANAEILKENARNYAKADPDRGRNSAQKKFARAFGVVCDLTEAQWREVVAEHGDRCFYCGIKQERLTMDHKTPMSRGGGHTRTNVAPACRSCNTSKRRRTAEEYFADLASRKVRA